MRLQKQLSTKIPFKRTINKLEHWKTIQTGNVFAITTTFIRTGLRSSNEVLLYKVRCFLFVFLQRRCDGEFYLRILTVLKVAFGEGLRKNNIIALKTIYTP